MTKSKRKPPERSAADLSTARRAAILRARSKQLAGRAETARPAARERLLICRVGPDLYGLPLPQVSKVRPLDRRGAAPGRPGAALGLIADGGEIRPLFDFATLLGRAEPVAPGGWLIVLAPPHAVALRVTDLPVAGDVEPFEGGEPHQTRIVEGEHAGKVLVRVSAADLLTAPANRLPGASAS